MGVDHRDRRRHRHHLETLLKSSSVAASAGPERQIPTICIPLSPPTGTFQEIIIPMQTGIQAVHTRAKAPVPRKAGIPAYARKPPTRRRELGENWIPAYAGMTEKGNGAKVSTKERKRSPPFLPSPDEFLFSPLPRERARVRAKGRAHNLSTDPRRRCPIGLFPWRPAYDVTISAMSSGNRT